MVYDVCEKNSFNKIVEWLKEIRMRCTDSIKIILLGNKIDLLEKREVSTEEGKIFAENNSLFFYEVSAKENPEWGIEKAFDIIVDECKRKIEEDNKRENEDLRRMTKRNTIQLKEKKKLK